MASRPSSPGEEARCSSSATRRRDQLPQYDPAFRATFASFKELTDPAALAVQPARIELVTLDQAMTLEQFQARYPSTIPVAELALINGVQPGDTLAAGRMVKRVTGGPPASP